MLSIIIGGGSEIGEPLVNTPDIGMIAFTGGFKTGETIANQGGVTKFQMELGSNSPVIVAKDAKLKQAVSNSVSGAFAASGQNCNGVQRSEEHTSELQSRGHLVCRLLLEKKKRNNRQKDKTK